MRIPGVSTFDLNQADDFVYFVKDGTPTSSDKYPSGIDDMIDGSADESNTNCGSGVNPPPIVNYRDCACKTTEAENEALLTNLEQAILFLENSNATDEYKKILRNRYLACIEVLEGCIINIIDFDEFGIAPDGRDLLDHYNQRSYSTARIKAVSLMISRGEYVDARSYLITYLGDFDYDYSSRYESLMTIYLDHLEELPAASNHITSLQTYAEDADFFKGFARALLCYYYDDCRFDDYGIQGINPRNLKRKYSNSFSIFPNPASQAITINSNESLQATIYSIDGKIIKTISILEGTTIIDISKIKNGIYFIRAFNTNSEKQLTQKFVKI